MLMEPDVLREDEAYWKTILQLQDEMDESELLPEEEKEKYRKDLRERLETITFE